MAEVAMTKEIVATKLVQEISKNGDHVPEEYLRRQGFPVAIDASESWLNDLLIDFSLLSSSSASEVAKLKSALSQWGCFQVINHGIERSFLEDFIEVIKQFFALPLEEKLKCYAEDDIFQGYGSDSLFSGIHAPNWNDRLFLTLNPKEQIKHQLWPQKPEKFREMINEYSEKITEVNKVIFKAMVKSLNISENKINYGKRGPTKARFSLYPRCPSPEQVLGINPHSDGTAMTYLLPEKQVEGLQILKDDQWYKVAVIPGALFVNIGDLFEVFSNGVFKSAVHRVGTNSMMDRVSLAMFFMPDNEEELIEPLSDLVSVQEPQLYKKFYMSEFRQKLFESFKKGARTVDAFRI